MCDKDSSEINNYIKTSTSTALRVLPEVFIVRSLHAALALQRDAFVRPGSVYLANERKSLFAINCLPTARTCDHHATGCCGVSADKAAVMVVIMSNGHLTD